MSKKLQGMNRKLDMTACMSDSISCLCNLEAQLIGLFVWKSLTCTGCACPVHFQDTGSK